MNIILIGFRCTGKTSVGRMLADRLGREFIDADEALERLSGKTVREIFEIKGETFFRKVESELLSELARLDGKVIATGGGAVLKRKNIQQLKRNGLVVLLDAHPNVLYERLKRDPKSKTQRPALTNRDLDAEIREQYEFRQPYYQGAADLTVDTAEQPLEKIVDEVERLLRERGIRGRHHGGGEAQEGAMI